MSTLEAVRGLIEQEAEDPTKLTETEVAIVGLKMAIDYGIDIDGLGDYLLRNAGRSTDKVILEFVENQLLSRVA